MSPKESLVSKESGFVGRYFIFNLISIFLVLQPGNYQSQ